MRLFDGIFARGRAADAVSDRAWLQAMLDAEAALARACAQAGCVPHAHADAIAAACDAGGFDAAQLGLDAAAGGNPVIPLVRALTSAVGGEAGGSVHVGATSQDILDTAAMLVAARTVDALLGDLERACAAAAGLAEQHRDTIAAGRTLLQHALPVTFGLKAAVWLTMFDDAARRLREVRETRLAAQLGGAAGTLASLGNAGVDVVRYFAQELELSEPALPWHTNRLRIVELAAALAGAAAAAGKVGGDVVLLAQTEVAEVHEGGGPGRGGSSTLPHKRNPVGAVSAVACAAQVPGLVATLVASAGLHEHERAAGAWQAEWQPLASLLALSASACAWIADTLEQLRVFPDQMAANLERTGDVLLAERITGALTPALGRMAAHDLVTAASREARATGRSLADVLADDPAARRHLGPGEVRALLHPGAYVGSASAFVDRALAVHRADEQQSEEARG